MSALLATLRAYLAERNPRERWLLVLVGLVLSAIVLDLAVIAPLSERADLAQAKVAQLERDEARALRITSEVRMLQGELASVEPRIRSGERTNLLSELEKLAAAAEIGESQLESIKERRVSAISRNSRGGLSQGCDPATGRGLPVPNRDGPDSVDRSLAAHEGSWRTRGAARPPVRRLDLRAHLASRGP